jgi:polyisoprenoid-binding protein YceI
MDISLNKQQVMQPRNLLFSLVGVGAFAIVAIALGMAYIWFSGGDGHASMATVAPELVLRPGDTRSLLHITPAESEVRFYINETLLGEPKTVIGTTDQVAGDLLVDFDNPANSQLGLIRINVRTLSTDSELRNRALRGQILEADQPEYEFAEFVPISLTGLPDTVTIGEAFTFQIIGDLTVHGETQTVTFDVTVNPVSHERLEGIAQTTVRYSDFDMSIPEAPGVAGIGDDVQLEIVFVANVD